jgi:hypothetical protein
MSDIMLGAIARKAVDRIVHRLRAQTVANGVKDADVVIEEQGDAVLLRATGSGGPVQEYGTMVTPGRRLLARSLAALQAGAGA